MKISEQWLREWVAAKLDVRTLAERLTLAGLEVGSVTPVAPPLEGIVVGEILEVMPHPEANRLRICKVNVGRRASLTIVCGATNAAAGLKVPTALEGAVLPDGTRIAKSAIRGVESAGMLCSGVELDIEETATGLLVLDRDARPGTPLSQLLRLDDQQLEVDLTPNRGDCLSVAGLAREISALTGARYTRMKDKTTRPGSRRAIRVKLGSPKACARYAGRAIEAIDPKAETPLWLRERLRRSGMRSIHPVVDITNYVMLELGQPLHAFDLGRLQGPITARFAHSGESLTLLDGKTIQLAPEDPVIADGRGPVALAGIMGGEPTAVSATTTGIFLESAWFRPEVIGVRARHHGLHSESSHRFERGVDAMQTRLALERASQLVLEICGGRAGPVSEALARPQLPRRAPIVLRATRIERVLGMGIPSSTVSSILKRLGMRVTKAAGGWRVTPPSWRFDVVREVDLIEELARVHGYDKLPARIVHGPIRAPLIPESRVAVARLRSLLVDRDYQEAITYSFVDPALQQLVSPHVSALDLSNPIAADMARMRTSLWPGLLQCVRYNHHRQLERVRLFEFGRRYLPERPGGVVEETMVTGIASGPALPKQWGAPGRTVDFFDVKADVTALLALTGKEFRVRAAGHPALHPGQSAEVVDAQTGKPIGLLGAFHPELLASTGLHGSVFGFELALEALQFGSIPGFREISRFPAVTRDLAVVVDTSVTAQQVLDCVKKASGELLINLELFDEYRGEGIDSGRKSLALGLTFQDTSRTLNEEDVETVVGRVVEALRTGVGGQLRQ
jgi:phenylalanyl-tRNA synthetase beta chain